MNPETQRIQKWTQKPNVFKNEPRNPTYSKMNPETQHIYIERVEYWTDGNSLIKDTFMCSYAHAHFFVMSIKKYICFAIPNPPPYLFTLAKILNLSIL